MKTQHEIAPQVEVVIIPGRRAGDHALQTAAAKPVTVIGAKGEPFLRIGSDGVFANAMSPTLGCNRGRAPQTSSPIALSNDRSAVRWTKISEGITIHMARMARAMSRRSSRAHRDEVETPAADRRQVDCGARRDSMDRDLLHASATARPSRPARLN